LKTTLFEVYDLCNAGKELYSPDTESSPAPSSDTGKATSRTNSFEIENLLKVRLTYLIVTTIIVLD
jgi:hypothetical protein